MEILDYENAVLSACLMEPGAVRKVALQLPEDRFTEGITRKVYQAVLDLYEQGKPINSLSVAEKMGKDDQEEYVKSLLTFFPEHQIMDLRGLDSWIVAVDNSGRLRQVALVVKEYNAVFKDFKGVIKTVTDVDEFISDFVGKLRISQGGLKKGYVPISDVAGEFQKQFDQELRGIRVARIPTDWVGWNRENSGGIPRGYLVVVAGLPGSGKTQLILQLLEQMAHKVKGCVAFNSLEMSRVKLFQRLAFAYGGLDAKLLGNNGYTYESSETKRVLEEVDKLSKLPFYIDDTDFATSSTISYQASALHTEKGPLEGLGIDYAELVNEPEDSKAASEELRVSTIFRKAKGLAKTLNTTVFLAAQYSRAVTFTNSKLGGNHNIRYSGAAEAVADVILHLYNPWLLRQSGMDVKEVDEFPVIEGKAYIMRGKDKDIGPGHFSMEFLQHCALWKDRTQRSNGFGKQTMEEEF